MKLFLYYALHSMKNQLKKLLKSWVLIFILVCALIGGLIGFGASKLSDMAEDEPEGPGQEIILPDDGEPWGGELPDEEPPEDAVPLGETVLHLVELIAGAVVLALLVFEVISADKNGSRIFLPADVNLLFAAPMRPQSVLLFRLMTQLGMALLASIYLLFQLPNLMWNVGLGLWPSLAVVAAWGLTIMIGKLVQTLLYTVCSTHPGAKPYIRRAVYVVLALVAVGWFVFWKQSGEKPLAAAMQFFCAPTSRWIPVWGWLKGVVAFAAEGSTAGALACIGLSVLTAAVLLFIIRRVRADFYEDAMAKSEEMAELLDRAQRQKSGVVFKKRKKDRDDGLRRDGLNRGAGAAMFFHKSLYNRFRFARLGVFTKTAETYLLTAVAASLLCRLVLRMEGGTGLILVSLLLGVFAFYRTMGNPLGEDTRMDYFRLVPESTWAKLFYSLLGGSVNCLLDLLPAMIASVLLLQTNPLPALAWLLFIVSVDFYGTCVGTFINLSTPESAGKTIKQMVQVMFLYFGLLPDVAAVAIVWVVAESASAGVLAGAAVNVVLGLLLFLLTPLFLSPRTGRRLAAAEWGPELRRKARGVFSRLGVSGAMILLISSAVQVVLVKLLNAVTPAWRTWPAGMWVLGFAPLYLVGVPVGLLIARRAPASAPEKKTMTVGRYLCILLICIFMMEAGNAVGILLQSLLEGLLGGIPVNPIETFATDDSLVLRILFLVILAPLIEEFIFRRTLIDRMRPYGEKLAVVTSAVMFGLFHGNLSQMFYAFALGLVFGYVYLRTGKLRCTVGLHMIINLFGGVVSAELAEWAGSGLAALEDLESLDPAALLESGLPDLSGVITPGVVALMVYTVVLLGCAVAGLVVLCIKSRRVYFDPAPMELPRGKRFPTVYLNAGMLLFVAVCLVSVVSTYL